MAKKDDSEVEVVKNIILDVLKTKLGATESSLKDGYNIHLWGFVPRDRAIQGNLEPVIRELNAIKYGLNAHIDEAIQELKSRME